MLPPAARTAVSLPPIAILTACCPARPARTGRCQAAPALSALFAVLGPRFLAMNAPEALYQATRREPDWQIAFCLRELRATSTPTTTMRAASVPLSPRRGQSIAHSTSATRGGCTQHFSLPRMPPCIYVHFPCRHLGRPALWLSSLSYSGTLRAGLLRRRSAWNLVLLAGLFMSRIRSDRFDRLTFSATRAMDALGRALIFGAPAR